MRATSRSSCCPYPPRASSRDRVAGGYRLGGAWQKAERRVGDVLGTEVARHLRLRMLSKSIRSRGRPPSIKSGRCIDRPSGPGSGLVGVGILRRDRNTAGNDQHAARRGHLIALCLRLLRCEHDGGRHRMSALASSCVGSCRFRSTFMHDWRRLGWQRRYRRRWRAADQFVPAMLRTRPGSKAELPAHEPFSAATTFRRLFRRCSSWRQDAG